MSSDASAAAASPMTNGKVPSHSYREADASNTSTTPAMSLLDICADLHGRISKFLSSSPASEATQSAQKQTRISIQVVRQTLQDYDFNALSLSYNGGKDCLVLLIIYLSTLYEHYERQGRLQDFPSSIPSIYAKPPDPFPAVTSFVESSSAEYHLDLVHISTNPGSQPNPQQARSHSSPPAHDVSDPIEGNKVVTFRDAFALYLKTHPQVKAIFVGTRRSDPHGAKLTHFDHTDGNWPPFMRIHPVIDWHLSEIWAFLRSPHLADPRSSRDTLDYCTMYDQGYTSLGGVNDTLQNPKLKFVNPTTGEEQYRPAFELTLDGEERLGRE